MTRQGYVTVLGFGSLLSERSSRLTFPDLINFRFGRVENYRRVFAHPASIFFQRGIANADTLEFSSLSAEHAPGHEGFVVCIYEVPNNGLLLSKDGVHVPSKAFREREEEFNIISVPYKEFDENGRLSDTSHNRTGILCTRSSDEAYLKLWGSERFEKNYQQHGISTIWNWGRDSGLRPCAPYLRHCVLAAKNSESRECFESFLDETFLVDRVTTVREYLESYPEIMTTLPPPELRLRYGG